MAVTNSFTGKQGQVTVDGTVIPITGWTIKMQKAFADATDSNTYDPVTGQVWGYQQGGVISLEGTVKGNIDLDTFDDAIIGKLTSDGPFSVTLALTRSKNFVVDSPFDFTDVDFNIEVPGASMASFTFSVKNHGVPTFG